VRNNNDETPLDLAINTNEEKIALLLLKNDAKFDLKNKNGDTSLHFAIKKKLYKFIKECVRMLSVRNMMITDKKKNDLIFMNNDKKTPLTCAKENTEKNEVDTKIIYLLEQIFEK
jgi:ankyrin repeat protein